ncbi:PrpF domain-containing protein [Alkalibacillus aidingensis]|uniref:PrpF domain-containing protein n=1 Tax=Alkalibacillus aidingensis TaxID=2747607 RepID=UPI0016615CBC|nr:PrpF domain-containing protein [Alkalibacillus aidingensis]
MSQREIPCTVYRGGTSRGLFFNKKDLPEDIEKKKDIFMQSIDTSNVTQINGLGGGTSHTSKICVIAPTVEQGIDAEYTFYQAGIGKDIIDDKGTCGNLMAAVGAYVVDQGFAEANHNEAYIDVSVINTNIDKKISIRVPVESGQVKMTGNFQMIGVKQPGSKFHVSVLEPGGENTGQIIPAEGIQVNTMNGTEYHYSLSDVMNPFVFTPGEEFNLSASDRIDKLTGNKELMDLFEELRRTASYKSGITNSLEEAKQIHNIPKVGVVWVPQDYVTMSGEVIKKEEVDIVAKMISMEKFHRTFAVSGLFALAVSCLFEDTIPNKCTEENTNEIRIGHPEGVVAVSVELNTDGSIKKVGIDRTVKRIIKGNLFYT